MYFICVVSHTIFFWYLKKIWEVKDGHPRECSISGLGDAYQDDNGDIRIAISKFDASYYIGDDIYTGHTYKEYYFYYDEDRDCIAEYGGGCLIKQHKAMQEQIIELAGFDLYEQLDSMGYGIGQGFYRENGILTVNYYDDSDMEKGYKSLCNVNYDCINKCYLDAWNEGDNTLEGSDFGGYYEPASGADCPVTFPSSELKNTQKQQIFNSCSSVIIEYPSYMYNSGDGELAGESNFGIYLDGTGRSYLKFSILTDRYNQNDNTIPKNSYAYLNDMALSSGNSSVELDECGDGNYVDFGLMTCDKIPYSYNEIEPHEIYTTYFGKDLYTDEDGFTEYLIVQYARNVIDGEVVNDYDDAAYDVIKNLKWKLSADDDSTLASIFDAGGTFDECIGK